MIFKLIGNFISYNYCKNQKEKNLIALKQLIWFVLFSEDKNKCELFESGAQTFSSV